MAAGLTAIHDCNLVHRDIKPSNIMVTRGGVRIIDFGIARTLDTTTDVTRSGIVMGSLGWTSPEQLEGHAPLPAMDVFAWGCVLAYAATGRHPFGGEDSASRSWSILNGEPDLSEVPETVADLVGAALDRDTERRPTAQELLLGLVGGTGPVVKVREAVPAADVAVASVVESTGRAPRRSRRWALLLAALPIALAAAVALSAATGGGMMLDRPARTSPSVPVESSSSGSGANQPVNQTRSGRTPAPTATDGNGGPDGAGGQSDTDQSVTGGQSESADEGDAGGQGNGNGNGNGPGTTPSKTPKG